VIDAPPALGTRARDTPATRSAQPREHPAAETPSAPLDRAENDAGGDTGAGVYLGERREERGERREERA
jgi:hypothetical protein